MNLIINEFLKNRSYKNYCNLQQKWRKPKDSISELPNRFVIFTQPRSGSNLLCGMLNSHPEILCHHEIFNPKRIYYSKDFHELLADREQTSRKDLIKGKLGLMTLRQRKLNPERFMFEIWKNNFGHKAVGFNLFPTHIPNASMSLIKDNNVKKIILTRRNKLKCYVSLLIARKTGVWDSYNLSKTKDNVSVSVNAAKLLKWSLKRDRYFENLSKKIIDLEQEFLEISYEDLTNEKSESVKSNLLEFIGVNLNTECLETPLRKQNSNNLKELIANFSELKHNLHGTELESYL